ncbi:MAG: hypothetical protein LH615_04175 [Ferruginibacter sp.]|nr:hypothetical protein [Ferruginibacter sp.]
MKKTLKKIKDISIKIKDKEVEILNIKNFPFKSFYNNPEIVRSRGLICANKELKELLNKEFTLLENLKINIEFEKAKNQDKLKKTILLCN